MPQHLFQAERGIALGAQSGLGCGQPLSLTTTYNASPKTRTGEVLGLRLASNRLAQLIAPLFLGVVGSWGGLVAVFEISGGFLLGGAFLPNERKDSPRRRECDGR